MIKSWRHKGLEKFYKTGSISGIQPRHEDRLRTILQFLDYAAKPKDIDFPGMKLHALKGNMKDYYAVSVNGNWRVVFKFEDENVILVDYLDYH